MFLTLSSSFLISSNWACKVLIVNNINKISDLPGKNSNTFRFDHLLSTEILIYHFVWWKVFATAANSAFNISATHVSATWHFLPATFMQLQSKAKKWHWCKRHKGFDVSGTAMFLQHFWGYEQGSWVKHPVKEWKNRMLGDEK
jgi:hypothetical protein